MKKNILLTALILVCALSMIYGFVQKAAAEKATIAALENKLRAEENEKAAMEQRKFAEMSRAEAELQRQLAMEAVANCMKKK
jgi:hypothetical protein